MTLDFLKMRAVLISLFHPSASTYTQERLGYLLLFLISAIRTLEKNGKTRMKD